MKVTSMVRDEFVRNKTYYKHTPDLTRREMISCILLSFHSKNHSLNL